MYGAEIGIETFTMDQILVSLVVAFLLCGFVCLTRDFGLGERHH